MGEYGAENRTRSQLVGREGSSAARGKGACVRFSECEQLLLINMFGDNSKLALRWARCEVDMGL